MKRASSVVALCTGLGLLVACGGAPQPSGSSDSGVAQALHDGTWLLTVNRALREGSLGRGLPSTPLAETDYAPVAGGATYRLAVSQNATRIEVVAPRMVGRLEQGNGERLTYGLGEGTFAGGCVVVWREPGRLEAELTIYGSGVPVVRSERGVLRDVQ